MTASTTANIQSLSLDTMTGLMRNLGVGIGGDGRHTTFNLFVIPTIPWHNIDNRFAYENELYPKLASYNDKYDRSTIQSKVDRVDKNMDKYLSKSGSKVTGKWKIDNFETGNVDAESLHPGAEVKLHIKVYHLFDCVLINNT